jgi:dihydrofolate reductase
MKVILVFVATLNGKITRGDDPEVKTWSSKNDQEHFSRVWKQSKLIVMGSNTYKRNVIKPSSGRLIIVMTGNPSYYRGSEVPGLLEFSARPPADLVAEFEKKGVEQMTVVGGSLVAASFLKSKLIDEIWLTLEPRIFGKGQNLIADEELDIKLSLREIEKANDQGTLITKYAIVK